MQKVISINLNGNAYQIDEDGYAALAAYLDGAERQLKDNPDRVEIVADLEQAIAEKCRRFLGPHKTVVVASEVEQIIKEMGPVHGDAGTGGTVGNAAAATTAGAAGGARSDKDTPRRLYLIREGSMIAGVCAGLAAYFHVDVTILRIIVIALTLLTKGGFGLVYLVLAFVIPSADTSEQRAAAHGQAFSAQDVIDQAKAHYAEFKNQNDSRRAWLVDRARTRAEWRASKRQWKEQWRQQRDQWRQQWYGGGFGGPPSTPPLGYGRQLLAGLMVPIVTVAGAVFFWIWVYALISLTTTRQLFGQALPSNIPLWVGILILVFAYQMVSWPLHAMRRGSHFLLGSRYRDAAALEGIMSVGFSVLVVVFAYKYVPEVREVLRTLPEVLRSITQDFRN
ncbi:MAG TPA: PspC domain-containing protein [Vicinamibacterales bacterium]|jgi:phage shock protein PspC (stress-responsive transcriptional regulator)